MSALFDGELHRAPKLDRGVIVKLRVQTQTGAPSHSKRGWKAQGERGSNVRMRIEKLFECKLIAASDNSSTLEVTFKRGAEDNGFLVEIK